MLAKRNLLILIIISSFAYFNADLSKYSTLNLKKEALRNALDRKNYYIFDQVEDFGNGTYGFPCKDSDPYPFKDFVRDFQELNTGTTIVIISSESLALYEKFVKDLDIGKNWTGLIVEAYVFTDSNGTPTIDVTVFQKLIQNLPRTVSVMINGFVNKNSYDNNAKAAMDTFRPCKQRKGMALNLPQSANTDFIPSAMANYQFIILAIDEVKIKNLNDLAKIIKHIKELQKLPHIEKIYFRTEVGLNSIYVILHRIFSNDDYFIYL